MEKYSIVKKANHLVIRVSGHMDEATAAKFFQEYKQTISTIAPAQTILEIDAKELSIVTSDMQESLKSCLALYQKTGFKQIIMHMDKSNSILSMQVKRIAAAAGLSNFSIA
ncbi:MULTISPECIES: hypothetical protein [Caproicibacterium]|uniref:STAS domain-containing protein n=1 Tax=Caproicibacterium argilliputei TaxID=3030016 RepID=A0AA97H246_9FIRM|nr:hypothetical protein [Caproicibacterium argilliputei]WOC33148.1 hypothetical protein PXC00_04535 [Caproicibacterium argilliputei]